MIEPLCRACSAQGRVTLATVADHIIPLSKGGKTEWDNYQPLCVDCHDTKTITDEGRAAKPRLTIGEDGWPI